MSGPIKLSKSYPSRYGVPSISRVDPRIFRFTYFTDCLKCDFCNDSCCQHGVDVDRLHYDNIMRHAGAIEKYTGVSRDRWFDGKFEEDPEVPGGATTRTREEILVMKPLQSGNRSSIRMAHEPGWDMNTLLNSKDDVSGKGDAMHTRMPSYLALSCFPMLSKLHVLPVPWAPAKITSK